MFQFQGTAMVLIAFENKSVRMFESSNGYFQHEFVFYDSGFNTELTKDQLKALQVPVCWSQWCLSSHHEHLPGSTAIMQSSGRTFPRVRARPAHFLSHSVRLK